MLEKGIRLYSEASWLEAFGNESLLGHAREKSFHTAFVTVLMEVGTFFENVLTSPLIQIREYPEFHDLMQRKERTWPGCLLVHGCLPALDSFGGRAI